MVSSAPSKGADASGFDREIRQNPENPVPRVGGSTPYDVCIGGGK